MGYEGDFFLCLRTVLLATSGGYTLIPHGIEANKIEDRKVLMGKALLVERRLTLRADAPVCIAPESAPTGYAGALPRLHLDQRPLRRVNSQLAILEECIAGLPRREGGAPL